VIDPATCDTSTLRRRGRAAPSPSVDAFTRDGLRFDVTDRGPAAGTAAGTVLLLHGFPQTSASWTPVSERLVAAGLRTLAPDQRGYSPGARPRGRRAYRIEELVADAAALVDAADTGPVHVVGHDWGALVAWTLAAHRPELVRTVTGVSVPHPGAFTRSLVTSRQGLLSWYVGAFQLPVLPERFLERPGTLAAVLRRSGQSPEAAERDAAALAGHLTGPINWYRAVPLAGPSTMQRPVDRPALMVWSDGDGFVSRASVDANPRFVLDRYRLEVLPGVSHWIPDEVPDRLADLVLEHVAK
jgi:pimeloyl-ACP methyl ester carboxylesterase